VRSLSLRWNRRRSSAAVARVSLCLVLAALGLAASTAAALAAGDDYGEVARWGGADAAGDARIGQAAGFAADPVDDSVYVVDVQSSSTTTGVATFRLRKFAGADGAVEGSATFTATGPLTSSPPSIGGVAVDHAAGHVYVTVVAPNVDADYVALQQIKVFDTEASGGALVAPSDVADGDLLSGTVPTIFYEAPIAVDPTTHDVLVSGYDSAYSSLVQRFAGVADGGRQPGDVGASWTDATAPIPVGLTVQQDGDVLFAWKPTGSAFIALFVKRISADFTTATALIPTAAQGGDANVGIIAGDPPNQEYTHGALGVRTLGAALVAAPDGSLLATTIGAWPLFSLASVTDPLLPLDDKQAIGVRRLTPAGEDAGIVAGGASSGSCSMTRGPFPPGGAPYGGYGVQPGADGKLFVPTWLDDQTVEMVVFGPGGEGCPVPVPALEVSANGTTVPTDGSVPIGGSVSLDLDGSDLKSWSLMEVDWDLDGDATNGPDGDGFEVKDRRTLPQGVDPGAPPSLQHEVTFDTGGERGVRARVLTTGGTSTVSRTLQVRFGPVAPSAAFSGAALGTVGSAVSFDASGSHVNPAGKVAPLSYEWDFGDGSGFVAGTKSQAHTYAKAGAFQVRVRVTDTENGLSATSGPQTVTITAKSENGGGGNNNGNNDGGGTQPDPPKTVPADPPPVAHDASATNLSPKLSVSGTAVSVALSCPATKAQCSASVTLRIAVKAKKGRKAVTKAIIIGSGKATLAGGTSKKLTIKLNGTGLKALKRAKALKFTAALNATDTYGGKKSSTLTGTLKQPHGKAKK
jgi:PKD domain